MVIATLCFWGHNAHSAALRQWYRTSEEDISTEEDVHSQTELVPWRKVSPCVGSTVVDTTSLAYASLRLGHLVEPLDDRHSLPCKSLCRIRNYDRRMLVLPGMGIWWYQTHLQAIVDGASSACMDANAASAFPGSSERFNVAMRQNETEVMIGNIFASAMCGRSN
jgi:hypothetical protein